MSDKKITNEQEKEIKRQSLFHYKTLLEIEKLLDDKIDNETRKTIIEKSIKDLKKIDSKILKTLEINFKESDKKSIIDFV